MSVRQLYRLRAHPSLFVWLNASDMPPRKDVEARYLEVMVHPEHAAAAAVRRALERTGARSVVVPPGLPEDLVPEIIKPVVLWATLWAHPGTAFHRRTQRITDALYRDADAIVIGPSNPVISIGPILAVPGMRAALRKSLTASAREKTIAVDASIVTSQS